MGKKFMGYDNASELITAIGNKIKAKYTKPNTGIPKSDLASGVQTSLGRADSAVQPSSLVEVVNNGAKNVLPILFSSRTYASVTITNNGDGSITFNGTKNTSGDGVPIADLTTDADVTNFKTVSRFVIPEGTYTMAKSSNKYLRYTVYKHNGTDQVEIGDATYLSSLEFTYNDSETYPYVCVRVVMLSGAIFSNVKLYPMMCIKPQFEISDEHEPFALGNQYLTPALVEQVDSGAKNKIPNIASSTTVGEAVFTVNSDGSVSVYTTAATTAARSLIILNSSKGITVNANDIVSGVPAVSDNSVSIEWGIGSSGNIDRVWGGNPGYKAIGVSGSIRYVAIKIESGKTISSSSPLKFYPMVCTKAAFDVSQKFVPYYNPASPVLGGGYEIPQNSSMDRLTSIGKWRCYNSVITATVTNAPFRTGFYGWTMNSITDSTRYIQIAIENTNVFNIAKRCWDGTSWSAWAYISSDAVTHYKADTTTTIGTDWTLTSIVLQAPVDALVPMTAVAVWGAKAPRGIRITRTNTSATNNVIATIEVSEDKAQIQASGFGTKLNGVNTYYVWAKAKESGTMPVYLTYSYPIKD